MQAQPPTNVGQPLTCARAHPEPPPPPPARQTVCVKVHSRPAFLIEVSNVGEVIPTVMAFTNMPGRADGYTWIIQADNVARPGVNLTDYTRSSVALHAPFCFWHPNLVNLATHNSDQRPLKLLPIRDHEPATIKVKRDPTNANSDETTVLFGRLDSTASNQRHFPVHVASRAPCPRTGAGRQLCHRLEFAGWWPGRALWSHPGYSRASHGVPSAGQARHTGVSLWRLTGLPGRSARGRGAPPVGAGVVLSQGKKEKKLRDGRPKTGNDTKSGLAFDVLCCYSVLVFSVLLGILIKNARQLKYQKKYLQRCYHS